MDLLDQFSNPLPAISETSVIPGMPSIIIPEPFILSEQNTLHLEKIRDEVMDKQKACENDLVKFYGEYEEFEQSWRIQPKSGPRPKGLSNTKSGETHRATETMATLWFRMMTAQDRFFDSVKSGLDPSGRELTESDLYMVEETLLHQLRKTHFKKNLLNSLRSLGLFGTLIFEEPWVRRLNVDGQTYFEGTGFQMRSIIQMFFDTMVPDLEMSDFMGSVDYPTIWRLRQWAKNDSSVWDKSAIEKKLSEYKDSSKNSVNSVTTGTDVLNRIRTRMQRAGYANLDNNIRELISYHGKIDTDNEVVQKYWESENRTDDPQDYDFTVGILDGDPIVKCHVTQCGTWRSKFKTCTWKSLELEPLGYGVGKIGQKGQAELDTVGSRADDGLKFSQYMMWKVGRYAGLKSSQLTIKPWNIVELDDINQLEPIRPDLNAIVQALAVMAGKREEFRSNTGASSNLQAVLTKATATESSITQTEAIRAASVYAEIMAEILIRDHLEQMHINNLDNLDEDIWVSVTGEPMPRRVNKNVLPRNIGFEIKVTTDKDFRPERLQKILETLQMATSIRNDIPESINIVRPLFEELLRAMGMNPRLLNEAQPMGDFLASRMRRMERIGANPQLLGNEVEGEAASAGQGGGITTPVGEVPTSPISPVYA